MTQTKAGTELTVPEMQALWRGMLDGMCADGCDPIDATEAMLAEAVRAKLQIDGAHRFADAMEELCTRLRRKARELGEVPPGATPVMH